MSNKNELDELRQKLFDAMVKDLIAETDIKSISRLQGELPIMTIDWQDRYWQLIFNGLSEELSDDDKEELEAIEKEYIQSPIVVKRSKLIEIKNYDDI